MQIDQRRVGIARGTPLPISCLQTLIFERKSALNFNPCAKFQTFQHLTPSSFRSIPTLLQCHTISYEGPEMPTTKLNKIVIGKMRYCYKMNIVP